MGQNVKGYLQPGQIWQARKTQYTPVHTCIGAYNYMLYIFYYVAICVDRLENQCTINVQHRHMLEISQKSAYIIIQSVRRLMLHVPRWLESSPNSAQSSATKRVFTALSPPEVNQCEGLCCIFLDDRLHCGQSGEMGSRSRCLKRVSVSRHRSLFLM